MQRIGTVDSIDIEKIIPDPSISIAKGGIVPLGKEKSNLFFWQVAAICEKYGVTLQTPIRDIPEEAINEIIYGTDERLKIKNESLGNSNYMVSYEGIAKYIDMQQDDDASASAQKWAGQFISTSFCPECNGQRLNKEALHFKINGKNIAELSQMDIQQLYDWILSVGDHISEKQRLIAEEINKEILSRLRFLLDVGLGYLSLSRASATLSGGESQRIRLATQIGSQLVNVLYIWMSPVLACINGITTG